MLSPSYPSLRAFTAHCHALGLYALALIINHKYVIGANGTVTQGVI